jgi:hypothetical protein
MSEIDEKIKLSLWVGGFCIIGSFLSILSNIASIQLDGFYFVGLFIMLICGLGSGIISGIIFGFLTWFLFSILRIRIHKIHYILICLLGFFIGLIFMRFLIDTGILFE